MTKALLPDLDTGTLAIQPLPRAETIPSSWYVDPLFHDFDREALFSRTWQLVGSEVQLVEPGSYLSASVAGNPIVVVRDRDGEIRAFYNVCRHRGGPLVTDACGRVAGVLQCKYHGWTYRLDGTLRGVPRFDRTELFDKRDFGLVPVRLDRWQGLLFAVLESPPLPVDNEPAAPPLATTPPMAEAAVVPPLAEVPGAAPPMAEAAAVPPLAEVLEGITERIAPLRLDALRFYRRDSYEAACNWKVYVDNYLEGYHVPLVHPELMKRLDFRTYATETAPWYSLQHSGLRAAGDGMYGNADEAAYYYFIFPNMMLNILPGRLQSNLVEPIAHDRCVVHFDYFYADIDSEAAKRAIAEDVAFSDSVQQEDVEICEHVQRGLASRAYDRGRFSVEMERGVYHFQCLLKEAYRRAL